MALALQPSPQVALLRREAEQARAEALLALAGEFSSCNCFLEVQAGAGGTESHDWTQMLLRMYTRWAEARGFSGECFMGLGSEGH